MTPHSMHQINMFGSSKIDVPEHATGDLWFGAVSEHRELFDALEAEWWMPSEGARGRVLAVRGFPAVETPPREGHRIPVRLRIESRRLPAVDVLVFRGEHWDQAPLGTVRPDDVAIMWPGPLPTSAVARVEVATNEEEVRLAGIARQVSNVPLPQVATTPDVSTVGVPRPPEIELGSGITLSPEYNQIRGAAAMGFWAIPRVDPWLDLLVASFGSDRSALRRCADRVEAPWLEHLPWFADKDGARSDNRYWSAAITVLREWPMRAQRGEDELVRAVAAAAEQMGQSDSTAAVDAWAAETRSIMRGDRAISPAGQRTDPVGMALQLVLARPHPDSYKRWLDNLPTVPPAVWWTGAVLCGLLNGYKRLPVSFRGEAELRHFLALHPLGTLPSGDAPLVWKRQPGVVIFAKGDHHVATRPEHARGRWFQADLRDPKTAQAAIEVAVKHKWQCIRRELRLSAGSYDLQSTGTIRIDGSARLILEGEARLLVPSGASIVEALDTEAFRRSLVVEGGGSIAAPPETVAPAAPLAASPAAVPGLKYIPGFLTEVEEVDLVTAIDAAPWLNELVRRVQHYGWRYDYKARRISKEMRIGSLPPWAARLAERLATERILPWQPDQVIVNEYLEAQGISKHIDCEPCFEEAVAVISLLESWEMIFRKQRTKISVARLLERRSLAVMTGDARYRWTHEIPARKMEPSGLRRSRRISITFRKVRAD